MSDLSKIAENAARAGAAVLSEHAGRVTGVRHKSSPADMVTAADVASGVAIVRAIADEVEGARFVVEEAEVYDLAGVPQGAIGSGDVWVIDPLDGTTSFVHSYPCYSVSVACLRDGHPIAGAVLNVPTGELFSAAAQEGAWHDGDKITCSGAKRVEEALVATGFPYDRGEPLDRQLAMLAKVIRVAHDIRRDGSAAVDLCNVAVGRTDGFWEITLKPWDMAAGVLIITEAGGAVTDLSGKPWTTATTDVVAANRDLHPALLELLRVGDR